MVDLASVVALPEADEWPEGIPRLEPGYRLRGGPVDPANEDTGVANWQAQLLAQRTRHNKNHIDKLMIRAGNQVTVGPGGDYTTIGDALSDLSEMRPVYSPGGFITELRLLAGYEMAEQVLVSGINMGWITITSEAAEVVISRGAMAVGFGTCFPAFGVMSGGVLPRIYTMFTMDATGSAADRCGIYANGGSATIGAGGGVKSAGSDGLRVEGAGTVTASGAIFSEAGRHGVVASGASRVVAPNSDMSNAENAGIFCSGEASVEATSAIATGCNVYGMRAVRGGGINAISANVRRNGPAGADTATDFSIQDGGWITATGATGGLNVTANTLSASGVICQ